MSSLEHHLHTHAHALRALARALVGAQDADDLLQETVLQALAAPPRRPGPWGGWLAQVVRHLASKHHRGERRRRRRETALAEGARAGGTVPAPEEQIAASETFRRLTQAVLALPAPYQDVVLRRYLQAQTPAVIAAQTGVPLATVKSRLQRGLDLLRQRLDGEGGEWRGAFAGMFGLRAAGASLAVGVTTGALVMTGTGVKFALGAAAVVLFAAGAYVYLGAGAGGSQVVGAGGSPAALTLAAERAAEAVSAPVSAEAEARRTIASPSPTATTALATLRGRVVDEHGQPRAGVHVTLTGQVVQRFDLAQAAAPLPPATWSDPPAQHTPADGTFAFAFAPREDLLVMGTVGKEMREVYTGWFDLPPAGTKDLGDIVLATPGSIRGRVVDAEGRAQTDVEVGLATQSPNAVRQTSSKVNANGEFVEPLLPPGSWYVSANGRGGSGRLKVDLAPGATEQVEVVLLLPGEQQTIRGRVVDERGRGLWDVRVRAPALMGAEANASTERDGTFVLVRPEHALVNTSPLQFDGRGFERLLTEPVAWGSKDLEFTLRGGLIVEVTAVAHDGTRIADFTAFVARQPEGQFAEHQALDFDLRSDAAAPTAVARVGPMLRGRHLVRVLPAGSTFASAAFPLDVRDPGPVRITIRVPQVVESTLRVRDQAGEPLAGSLVELLDPLGQRVDLDTYAFPREKWTQGSGSQRRVDLLQAGRTDAAGELRLRGPARDDLALRLRSEHHQFFVVQPFALGALPQVEVTVPRGATLTVRVDPALVRQWRTRAGIAPEGEVSRSDRARLPGIKVWRSRPGNPESVPPQFDPSQPFDDLGVCKLRGLPPARWWVDLTISGRSGANLQLDDLHLSEGEERELVLRLPELHEGEVRGAVLLNTSPLVSATVSGSVTIPRQREYPLRLSDQDDTDAAGRFTLHLPQGAARLRVSTKWPGTDDWFSVDLPAAIPTASGAVVEHDIDLRMGRVRCSFVDARGKPIAGLPALIFGTYRTWSSPSDNDGRTRWLPLTAGEWRLVADPKRLLDPATRQAFNAAHEGDPDPTRLLRVDLGTITVTAGADREVEVRVPEEWFR